MLQKFLCDTVPPHNQGRSGKTKALQEERSVREVAEVGKDVIATQAEVVQVQKPVEKHQSQVLEEEGSKYLGHTGHHVPEVQQSLMEVEPFWGNDTTHCIPLHRNSIAPF